MSAPAPHKAPARWILWHPEQKLWNWRLEARLRKLGKPFRISGVLVRALVLVDSVLLLTRVMIDRSIRFGPRAAGHALAPSRRTVLYVDCGVHREGREVRFVAETLADRCDLNILAFEASADHCAAAQTALADIAHLDLRQLALVGPDITVPELKLSKGAGDGRADSLWQDSDQFEMVPTAHLSRILRDEFDESLRDAAVLIRMNIEGSELGVLEDLVGARVATHIDGWFGMWDDVAKLAPEREAGFLALRRRAGIRNVTFNDRDLRHPLRRRAIALALDAACRRAAAAKPASGSLPGSGNPA
ncbi:MAG TPA: hypothetical protein VFR41_15870 [Acidimicrobiia bacterium]|nr:hypothetical protein [Acidimicrobiia bacterium]